MNFSIKEADGSHFGYFIQLNCVQILVNYIVVLRLFITSIDVLD